MILVLFGPPGAGKGTQAAIVSGQLGIPHVSTGVLMRAEVSAGSALGSELAPILDAGLLVPDELTLRVLEARLAQDDAVAGVLLDGFPRTVPQAEALDTLLEGRGLAVNAVINLDVPVDVLKSRIAKRSEAESRSDDTPEALERRIAVYRADTEPVLRYYRRRGARVEDVDGVGSIDEITGRISERLASWPSRVSS